MITVRDARAADTRELAPLSPEAAAPTGVARHAAARVPPKRGLLRTASAILAWLLIAAIVAVVGAAAIVPRARHAVPLVVLSGSMRPTLEPGDLLIVDPVRSADGIEAGDVITFQPVSDDPTLITHRVVAVQREGGRVVSLVTRGDANGADDPAIVAEQVQGLMLYSLPKIGFLAAWMTGARSWIVTIAIVALFAYSGYAMSRGVAAARRERRKRCAP